MQEVEAKKEVRIKYVLHGYINYGYFHPNVGFLLEAFQRKEFEIKDVETFFKEPVRHFK